MAVIKGVLREELENSKEMKKNFEKALIGLPKGALFSMKRKGRDYFYLKVRENNKVNNYYMGKPDKDTIEKYSKAKELRKKYRNSLSKLKKQIRFLTGVLRGKESI